MRLDVGRLLLLLCWAACFFSLTLAAASSDDDGHRLTESDIFVAVISSTNTIKRMVAVHNTWAAMTNATVRFFVAVPADEQDKFRLEDHIELGDKKDLPDVHPYTHQPIVLPRKHLDVVMLPIKEKNTHHVCEKTFMAFQYVHKHYPHHKYYVKCDDDTLLVVPNLVRALRSHPDHNADLFLGRTLWNTINSGGAGYVLSRGTLARLAPHIPDCIPSTGSAGGEEPAEDVTVAECLRDHLGVRPTNQPGMYFASPYHSWQVWRHEEGLVQYPISFHWLSPESMFDFSYLLMQAQLNYKPFVRTRRAHHLKP